ncbi:sialate O-acetylesterase [Sediminibacterium sp.]|uniref:sialate O-acetylesterase n=1 Tax=Sediminibacterium sp. TaxID=1917865 RepID=UPI0027355AE0|nr:sialate O-acetylesterase [Sediminibacterium sp.]
MSVNKIFTDHMVLQRDQPIHIWGRGLPGAAVKVSLSRTGLRSADSKTLSSVVKSVVTSVRLDSSWSVNLPALKASTTPHEIIINSCKKNILISNVLLGDIWICIGQSNMEWPMQREMYYREAITTANQPLLRFYNPTYAGKNVFNQYFSDSVLQMMQPEKFFAPTSWQVSDSNSFRAMSAVAYYYGKSIVTNTQVPIGLINLSIAGAPLETFIGVDALKSDERFAAKAIEPWLTNPAIPVWVKERGNQNLRTGTNHPFKPGHVYEAGLKPLFPLAIKGIINYQGESNAQEMERVNEYAALTQLMVQNFRGRFQQPMLPYFFVQLSSIDSVKYKGQYWHLFRDEQRKIMERLSYSGMAVCTDYGLKDNVHPTNKKIVGERLARWALNKEYGLSIVPSGPLPLSAQYANGQLQVTFNHAKDGLATADGKSLRGFSLDGIHEVSARIQKGTLQLGNAVSSGAEMVVIDCEEQPEYIYYDWKPYTDGNLVNREQIPTSTFKIKVHLKK